MDETKKEIWFPAKRYGWGCGPPFTWQGWVVMAVWLTCFIVGEIYLIKSDHWVWYAFFVIAMVTALILICLWKGEKPRWR